ncbi:MAG: hypothetical protein OHK0029_19490 [Armatimonadaceae bacterium]
MDEQLRLEEEEINIILRRAWDRALRTLATRVNEGTFKTHFRAIRPLTLSETQEKGISVYHVTLGVPSAFTREWVEKRHAHLIADVLGEILDCDVRLTFSIVPREKSSPPAAGASAGRAAAPAAGSLFDTPTSPDAEPQTSATDSTRADSERGLQRRATPPPSPTAPDAPENLSGAAPDAPGISRRNEPRIPSRALQLLMEDDSHHTEEAEQEPADTAWIRRVVPFREAGSEAPAVEPTHLSAGPPAAQSPLADKAKLPGERRNSAGTHSRSSASTGRSAGASSGTDAPFLNPRYTFDNFVTGSSNRLAHAGSYQVALNPGEVYNPLFLYGPPGLGKTHLMHAIGNEFLRTRGGGEGRIAYVSGEAFTTSFITSLREHRTEEFRRKWRSVDLWLVDDIQFIAGKEQTKEEFFHTFNALYQLGKQIVICSDRSPRELRAMDERLRSRFECGLIADIAPPDLETRLAILHRKAEIERMRIPDDVLLYMARLVQSNIRTLEGALVKLIAYASLQNSPVTTELATSILERYYISPGSWGNTGAESNTATDNPGMPSGRNVGFSARTARETATEGYTDGYYSGGYSGGGWGSRGSLRVTPEMVQRVVAKRLGISAEAMNGKKRDKETAQARQIAMHLMRELTEMSLPGIGELFGGRDHSTVMYACDKVRSQMEFDDDLRSLVEDLALQLRAQGA